MDDNGIYILMGVTSGVFLVLTLFNMFKRKLFWIADLGLDLAFTIFAPLVLGGGTLGGAITALAFGVAFTLTLRIMHMFIPGEKLSVRKHRGLPQMYWKTIPPQKLENPLRRRW